MKMLAARRKLLAAIVLSLAARPVALPAWAQEATYPSRPVKVFVPFGAGGTADLIARIVAAIPNVMVVSKQLPVENLEDFVELAKKSPSKLNFGSIGNATSQHLGGELFKMRTGIDMGHVPYRNNGALTGDRINGTLHVVFDNLPNVLGQVQLADHVAAEIDRWSKVVKASKA